MRTYSIDELKREGERAGKETTRQGASRDSSRPQPAPDSCCSRQGIVFRSRTRSALASGAPALRRYPPEAGRLARMARTWGSPGLLAGEFSQLPWKKSWFR